MYRISRSVLSQTKELTFKTCTAQVWCPKSTVHWLHSGVGHYEGCHLIYWMQIHLPFEMFTAVWTKGVPPCSIRGIVWTNKQSLGSLCPCVLCAELTCIWKQMHPQWWRRGTFPIRVDLLFFLCVCEFECMLYVNLHVIKKKAWTSMIIQLKEEQGNKQALLSFISVSFSGL